MAFDGIFTRAITKEMADLLIGGRINKIQQPNDRDLLFQVRAQRKNNRILLSIHSEYARFQKTEKDYEIPDTPPNFCMLLRKYIDNALIENIEQVGNDRIVIWTLEKKDELGDSHHYFLVHELMGRHSNLLLLDEDKDIVDLMKHVPPYQNRARTLLPNFPYERPPHSVQLDPFAINPDQDIKEEWTVQEIQQEFEGIGRESGQEILFRFENSKNSLYQTIAKFSQDVLNNPKPCLIQRDKFLGFYPLDYQSQEGERTYFDSFSALLDRYYDQLTYLNRSGQLGQQINQVVQKELKHQGQKLKNLAKDLKKTDKAKSYQLKGELLTTFMHQVEDHSQSVVLENYYDNNAPVEISLDPALTVNENAQKYFKRYTKLRNSLKYIQQEEAKAKEEIDYLEGIESQLELSDLDDLEEIRQELIDQGYLKENRKGKKKKVKESKPLSYRLSDGSLVLVGRNNKQNDQLTMRTANKNEYWFHVRNLPGSHVILRDVFEPSEQQIQETAELAAYHSKARQASNVPVDYTKIKDVHKPNGAKPGFVNYFNQQTIFVTPLEKDILEKLDK